MHNTQQETSQKGSEKGHANDQPGKRPYAGPQLIVIGDIAEITRAMNPGSPSDGFAGLCFS